jgi:hypothetical protein
VYFTSNGLVVASRISGNEARLGGGTYQFPALIWPSLNFIELSAISNCVVDNNHASDSSGGVYVYGGPGVANCVISNNTATNYYGGITAYTTLVANCTIVGNVGSNRYGGGIIGVGSILSNCQVIANVSPRYNAGGIYFDNGGPNMALNCVFANNLCGSVANGCGAGVVLSSGAGFQSMMKNCLIYCNTNVSPNGAYGGGALYIAASANSTCSVINCTIVSNQSYARGGAIYFENYTSYPSNYLVKNCILYANVATNANNDKIFYPEGATNSFWWTCADTNLAQGQGNITNYPLFVDKENRNYRLSKGSPCSNTGTNESWMTDAIDLIGHRRIDKFSGLVDMGCYEYVPKGTMYIGY